ncbi:MAG: DUF1538 domain-containing protein [Lachnospiraceae bacterium]|nr:DUF1538 domain-containing protein [Lachnospiraceae bacterium]
MLSNLLEKSKESLISVLPVVVTVIIMYFLPFFSMSVRELLVFLICAVFLIIGISLFNLGADMALTPIGEHVGSGLTKTRKFTLLILISFFMGVLITIAEPDLSVLAEQVKAVINPSVLIFCVGFGVGLLLVIAIVKIVFQADLGKLLMLFYAFLFAISTLLIETGHSSMIPLSFDSGGVTTGPVTVPFIMSLGVGIAGVIGGKNSKENAFGLIALCSIGPMIAVMLLSLFSSGNLNYSVGEYSMTAILNSGIGKIIVKTVWEIAKALFLIILFFLIVNFTVLKLPSKKLIQIGIGLAYTFAGLVAFLTAVQVGFMPVGYLLGTQLAGYSKNIIIVFGFIIGTVVVLAEPAVHVLNNQVEEITGGTVTKKSLLIALSVGVGISIGLSMIRIVYGFSLLYYIVPGYLIALTLSISVPGMYSAIAFDSGGVASGPLTSSFILPMAIGACMTVAGEDKILESAFGIVAMVAMTPLITIQLLGFRAITERRIRENLTIRKIMQSDDEQIIYFDV